MKRKMQLNILGESSDISEELFVEKLQEFVFEGKKHLLMGEVNLQSLKKWSNQLVWFCNKAEGAEECKNHATLTALLQEYSQKETIFKQELMMTHLHQKIYELVLNFMSFRASWISHFLEFIPESNYIDEGKVSMQDLFELLQTDLSQENLLLHENMRIFAYQIARELRVYNGIDSKRKSIFRQVDGKSGMA